MTRQLKNKIKNTSLKAREVLISVLINQKIH